MLAVVLFGVLSTKGSAPSVYIGLPFGIAFYGVFGFWKHGAVFGHQIHWLHVAGMNLAATLCVMFLVRLLISNRLGYEQKNTGEVNLEPWKFAKVASGIIVAIILGIYFALSGWGILPL